MNKIKKLIRQLKAVQRTLNELDNETPDNQGNYGQYSDLHKDINDFLIDDLNQ